MWYKYWIDTPNKRNSPIEQSYPLADFEECGMPKNIHMGPLILHL